MTDIKTPQSARENSEEGRLRHELRIVRLPALIGAAGAVLAALVGNLVGNGGQIGVGSAAPQSAVTVTVTETQTAFPTAPTATLATLESSDAILRSAPKLVISGGFSFDLDSAAPDWGRASSGSGDIWLSPYQSEDLGITDTAIFVSGPPALATCLDPGRESAQHMIPIKALRAGKAFCVKTSQDNWAWLNVLEWNESARQLTMQVLVFAGQA